MRHWLLICTSLLAGCATESWQQDAGVHVDFDRIEDCIHATGELRGNAVNACVHEKRRVDRLVFSIPMNYHPALRIR